MNAHTAPSSQGTPVPAFVTSLFEMVSDPTTNHLITWTRGGDSLVILDKTGFQANVLPRYFKTDKLNSFVRQLNMYNFEKLGEADWLEYRHPYFQHGRQDLLRQVTRQQKSSGARSTSGGSGGASRKRKLQSESTAALANRVADLEQQLRQNGSELAKLRQMVMSLVRAREPTELFLAPLTGPGDAGMGLDMVVDPLSGIEDLLPQPKRRRLAQTDDCDGDGGIIEEEIVEVESVASTTPSTPVDAEFDMYLSAGYAGPTTATTDPINTSTPEANQEEQEQEQTNEDNTHNQQQQQQQQQSYAPQSKTSSSPTGVHDTVVDVGFSFARPGEPAAGYLSVEGLTTEGVYCTKALLLLSL
eukprot:TRINITY_DN1310_c2_g1_i1.p1 TRINITY_DN1310_c2_g1~~TRINITY_DN1310_c2_g1_i1.p1  ORF type:complete len:358 (-),score=91.77 TRINITY_DN1310_c2_g1_i1:587-1660(-)